MMCAISNSVHPSTRKRRKLFGLPMQLDASVWFVVVAVLLAGIVAGAMHMVKESRVARARLEMDSIRSAVLEYEAYMGHDIANDGGLSVLFDRFQDPSGDWHEAILQEKGSWTEKTPKDPWGNPYTVSGSLGDTDRAVVSQGPNGAGTEKISVSL